MNSGALSFEWDFEKDLINIAKHGVDFNFAQRAFKDSYRIIAEDMAHSEEEKRYFCIGKVDGTILTVRFNMARQKNSNFWRRLLAEGKSDL